MSTHRYIGALVSKPKYTRSRPASMGTLSYLLAEGKITVERAQEIASGRGKEIDNGQIGKSLLEGLKRADDMQAYIRTHPQVLTVLLRKR